MKEISLIIQPLLFHKGKTGGFSNCNCHRHHPISNNVTSFCKVDSRTLALFL